MLSGPAAWGHYRDWLLVDCRRAPRTVSAYRHIVWAWFAHLDPKPWHRATSKDLRRFLDRPTRSGRAKGRHLAANTRLHYAATVKAFYAWAHAAGHLRRDPMAGFKLPRGGQPVARSFDPGQLRQIILTAELLDNRLHVMAALAYGAGLRCAEIAGLRIEDVHLERRGWVLVGGKGGKSRSVPLYPEVKVTIRRLLAARGHPRVGPLVESRTRPGEPMTPQSVSRALSDHIRRTCGINGSGHGLRHSFATDLLTEAGEEKLVTISRLLGHADTKTTERVYVLAFKGAPDEVVSRLPYPRRPDPRHVDPRQTGPREVGR